MTPGPETQQSAGSRSGSNTTGNFNIAIGAAAGDNITTANNVICIGTNIAGENEP